MLIATIIPLGQLYSNSLTWNVGPFWDDSHFFSPWFQGSGAVRSWSNMARFNQIYVYLPCKPNINIFMQLLRQMTHMTHELCSAGAFRSSLRFQLLQPLKVIFILHPCIFGLFHHLNIQQVEQGAWKRSSQMEVAPVALQTWKDMPPSSYILPSGKLT